MGDRVITGVGAELKRAREAAGLAIGDVAERLKLVPRQIESLEHERFDRLPGPSIARGMVRNYARLLDLDPEPLVERMAPAAEKAPEPVVPRHRQAMPPSNPNRRSTLLYVGSSVVVLAVMGVFVYQWQHKEAVRVFIAPVEPQPPQPPIEQKPVEEPATIEKPAVVAVEAEPPPPPPKPEPAPAPLPALQPGVHRLVLRMEQEAWVEVRDRDGRSLVSSLNAAGSERAVRGQPPFEVVIGNAPHVNLTYDGKPVDLAPHTKGEVARFTLN